jgi:hypothetical protein
MKELKLPSGDIVFLDDEDYAKLSNYKYYLHKKGYVYRKTKDKKVVYIHREIMGNPIGKVIDHINHNKLDNRKENLRAVSNATNIHNSDKPKVISTSKYKGVCWAESKNAWLATIWVGNEQINIGKFKTEDSAANAYNHYVRMHRDELAHLNDVPFDQDWEKQRIPDRKNGTGKSKYIGVSYRPKYDDWMATIRINGKSTYLGTFKDEVEAAKAYNNSAIKYRGDKAKLNDV